jgi:hypothetical protein
MLQPQELFISWGEAGWRQSPFKWESSLEDSQSYMISQTDSFSYEILSPTDWYVTRQVEEGVPVPAEIGTWRQEIRDAARIKKQNVLECDTKEELNDYTKGEEYLFWPDQP